MEFKSKRKQEDNVKEKGILRLDKRKGKKGKGKVMGE